MLLPPAGGRLLLLRLLLFLLLLLPVLEVRLRLEGSSGGCVIPEHALQYGHEGARCEARRRKHR